MADREGMAAVYGISQRTVRRYCEPVDYDGATRRALYDVLAAEAVLAAVLPRPARSVAAARLRKIRPRK